MFAEILARVFLVLNFGINTNKEMISYLKNTQDMLSKITHSNPAPIARFAKIRAHPYFGYVNDWEDEISIENKIFNRQGFRSEFDYPYKKQSEKEFVVGIFGGSLASMLASHLQKNLILIEKLKSKPVLKNKKIIILNFAFGAYAQPQQFHVASSYIKSIDLLINIDGFNEIRYQNPSMPQNFPAFSEVLFNSNLDNKIDLLIQFSQASIRRKLINVFSFSPIDQIAVAHLIWRTFDSILNFKNQAIPLQIKDSNKKYLISHKDFAKTSSENWSYYIKMMSIISKGNSVPSVFFIQPNQHLKKSKPLSKEEKIKFFDAKLEMLVNDGYRELLY